MFGAVRLAFLASVLAGHADSTKIFRHESRKFPDHLLFGAATAAYQIEGAWNEDGKSESIWDRVTHMVPCVIANCDTGDVADDSYHQYKRDVEMMRELGLDFYRFSLSWTRILPTSFPDHINEKGVQYYNNLINEMLKYNIQPMVTIYHWDLPQKLQDLGGWTNPHIVDWFTDYSRVVFQLFGDRVKYWVTINEPREVCGQGYGMQTMAPLLNYSGYADYICAKNILLAHANAYHLYNDEFREAQGGQIGISLSAHWYEPESENEVESAEVFRQFEVGIYANPIFSKLGDFPSVVKEKVAARSQMQGFPRSRLPELTPEEIEFVKGSSDFFGLNHYTTFLTYVSKFPIQYPTFYYADIEVLPYQPDEWNSSYSKWMKVVPWGFYKVLTKIREEYNNPPVFITENGYASPRGLIDDDRIDFYRKYINAMLDAIEDGSDVRAYTAWSLMDNLEWMSGYTERFGLYEVDYESPERIRTPRKSAYVYKEMLRIRVLDYHYEPDMSLGMNVDDN
ncbi:seminal fluid protein CSSFP001 [Danaus plexippus plexippus]|uniref:Seminal fluid protein CSSFP001 n=1 Tax=Danaus plexippus plexippus TaxID=278856 RepID=A0A212FF90_DANPL|nr:seminal fluid protein CSSFP001 [Danaus plexippus plexippus]